MRVFSFEEDSLNIMGARIKDLRLKKGYTQQELAKKMGYTSRSTINKIEKGLVDLTQSKILEFSRILDCSPMYLLFENEGYVSDNYSIIANKDGDERVFYLTENDFNAIYTILLNMKEVK